MKKKLVSALLCTAMVTTMIAGCGGAWQHSPAKSTLLYDEKGDGVMALNEISTAGTKNSRPELQTIMQLMKK